MNIFVWCFIIIGGGIGLISSAAIVAALPIVLVYKCFRKAKYGISMFD